MSPLPYKIKLLKTNIKTYCTIPKVISFIGNAPVLIIKIVLQIQNCQTFNNIFQVQYVAYFKGLIFVLNEA